MSDSIRLPGHEWPRFDAGWVWLCGAGPGDPGLLTLHALNALRQADVVVYDALVGDLILEFAAPGAELIPAGKRGGRPSAKQADISLKLVQLARAGKRVLRLKGGDPLIFGRGAEEAQTLAENGVPVRIIPGISAAVGGLASAGVALTHRDFNHAVSFVTGHDAGGETPGSLAGSLDWQAISRGAGLIVIYMGLRHMERIAKALIAAGRARSEPVAVVSNATLPTQRVLETTLVNAAADIKAAQMPAPALICVGPSVLLRDVLARPPDKPSIRAR